MYMLRKITIDDEILIKDYQKAMLESNSSMDGCSGLSNQKDIHHYICQCIDYDLGINIKKNHVSSTQYICLNDKEIIVGMCSLRHYLNDILIHVGGHIGYSVHPSYRKQGVATYMLKELIKICNTKNINPILLTCLQENIGSKKTIIKCGGIYEDTRYIGNDKIERYWIYL